MELMTSASDCLIEVYFLTACVRMPQGPPDEQNLQAAWAFWYFRPGDGRFIPDQWLTNSC